MTGWEIGKEMLLPILLIIKNITINCKKYQQISATTLKELDLLKPHCDKNPEFKPDEIIFIVGCRISPQARDGVKQYGVILGFVNITIWSEVELDERAKATDGVLEEFLDLIKIWCVVSCKKFLNVK